MTEWSEGERVYLRRCAKNDICRWLSTFCEEDVKAVLEEVWREMHTPKPTPTAPPKVHGPYTLGTRRPRGRGSTYTDEEKQEVVAFARAHTVAEAGLEFAVSRSSIRSWMHQ